MRYIKKLALYAKNPVDDRFSVLQDNRIVTDSKVSLQVPAGTKIDRITSQKYLHGAIRYNTDLKEFEVYNSDNATATSPNISGGWEILRTIRQATITAQNLGYGNYNDIYFGPLRYAVDVTLPQNILVFVDNVYQTPVTNYTLDTNPVASTATVVVTAPIGTSTLYLNTLTNIDLGAQDYPRQISGPVGTFRALTTLTNVSTVYDYFQKGYPVTISTSTIGIITSGTQINVTYSTGTYIKFTGLVPAKPVLALLGFDGYFPAGPTRNQFES
jgi:hypothetical protein